MLVGAGAGAGILLSSLPALLTTARSLSLTVVGIRYTIRTPCDDASFHIRALENARVAFDMGNAAGYSFTLLDIGAGFPIESSTLTSDVRHTNNKTHLEAIAATLVSHVDRLFPSPSIRVLASATEFLSVSSHTLVVDVVGKRPRTVTSRPAALSLATSTSSPSTKKRRVDEATSGWQYVVNDGILASYDATKTSLLPVPLDINKASTSTGETSSVSGVASAGVAPLVTATLPELQVGDWLVFPNIPQPASLDVHVMDPPTVRYVHT